MTTFSVSRTSIRSRVALWVSAIVLLAAILTVTLVLTLRTTHDAATTAPRAGVQTSQYNQICAPAPSTRFC